jgi:hypothetical protein
MAAKKPVLFVSNIKDNIIKKAEAGTVIEHEDAYAVAKSIKEYSYKSKDERKKVGEKGYDYLLEHYTISVLTDKLENLLIEIKRK